MELREKKEQRFFQARGLSPDLELKFRETRSRGNHFLLSHSLKAVPVNILHKVVTFKNHVLTVAVSVRKKVEAAADKSERLAPLGDVKGGLCGRGTD